MSTAPEQPSDALSEMWSTDGDSAMAFDEDCSPTRVCRNAREFSFEGIAEDGGDLQSAWRALLEREGKLHGSGETVRDLVLGPRDSN
jgi:hypothetical protein